MTQIAFSHVATVGLDDDQKQFFQMSRNFAMAELAPRMLELDAKEMDMPHDVMKRAAELGFGAIYVNSESGVCFFFLFFSANTSYR